MWPWVPIVLTSQTQPFIMKRPSPLYCDLLFNNTLFKKYRLYIYDPDWLHFYSNAFIADWTVKFIFGHSCFIFSNSSIIHMDVK